MDIFTKGVLWDYWKMGGDEIEISDDESSDLEEYWSDKEEIVEIFKIETNPSNDCWKRWKSHEIYYHDYNEGEYENETHEDGHELCGIKTREVPVCQINLPYWKARLLPSTLIGMEALEESELKDGSFKDLGSKEYRRILVKNYKSGDLEVLES
ncbi:hypothetical protein Tco_0960758 [Tanacetum coccineum]